ncbi:MAG TPA: hypothetical protein PKC76_12150 [Saprospiraceae bacterium]|nr:hypothetical protein [Saprospiraceae bacterium]HMP24881.1 hypothetical protein [Saprospiraceae bacterium]
MNRENRLRLWSIQANTACEWLEKNGVLQTPWSQTPLNWRPAYRWMTNEMHLQDIDLQDFAPIWAWHSCNGVLQAPPTLGIARNLLSDLQIIEGCCVVEFDAPASLCLLSSYQRFNELLDVFLDDKNAQPQREDFLDMFTMHPIDEYDSIQAALPRIDMEWVRDIRSLEMKPDSIDYDWNAPI